VQITADDPFKVDICNGDLEGLERVKIIGFFSNRLGAIEARKRKT
jgi:hypothetical protein